MSTKDLVSGIVQLIRKAETDLPPDVVTALKKAYQVESGVAKIQLGTMLKNIQVAKVSGRPLCQDTGVLTFFVHAGVDSPFRKDLSSFLIQGVEQATREVPLRPNTVDVLTGKNHGTQGMASSVFLDMIPGDRIDVSVLVVGSGAENMSRLGMLLPSVGLEGVSDFIVDSVVGAGGQPCPPTVVGIGVGGGTDLCLRLGKQSLLRPVGKRHPLRDIAQLEETLIRRINQSGVGSMGLGGRITVLDVHVEVVPRHPASLPVSVMISCWALRRASLRIFRDGSWEVQ